MPWVRFIAAFDFKPKASITLAYRAGEEKLVTTPCAEAAVSAGKGTIIRKRKGKVDG